jgi:phage-related protein
MNAFIINETINSRANLGLRITEPPVLPPAKRIVQTVQVDGREGTLTILTGWEDIVIDMKVAAQGSAPHEHFRGILPTILAAKTLSFSEDAGVFFRVKHVRTGGLTRKLSRLYEFPLSFTCDPFRYKIGVSMITMTAPGSVANPGTVFSLPRIKIYGTGSQTLTVGGKQTKVNILSGNITLDSELMECYRGDTAQNNQMQEPFPAFEPGANTLAWSSGITKLEIEPRWRYL